IFNVLTTYWIKNSTYFGFIMAILVNTVFISTMFTIFHLSKRSLKNKSSGLLIFILFWLAFEYLHFRWEINWPWLTTGNVFAFYPKWIQWYEYTGVLGGSLWVLIINTLVYKLVQNIINKENKKRIIVTSFTIFVLFLIPLLISYNIFNNYIEKEDPYTVVVVQPNIDPYNEKYGGIAYDKQIKLMLELAEQETDENTDLVVFPESAIQEPSLWERELEHSYSMDSIRKFLDKYPNIDIIMGSSTYKRILEGEDKTYEARQYGESNIWYYAYNTAMFMDTSKSIQLYHKSKLVLGVERMPLPKTLGFLKDFALDMGGTVGTLAADKERTPFVSSKNSLNVGTTICYESLYGEFCNGFVKNGANLLCIITNDGWWGNTAGHRQHYSFAPLRAIETRRSIARSANTGTSVFVNQRGEVFQPTDYWVKDVIKHNINANSKITFYVVYGDYIGRVSCFVAILLLLFAISRALINKKNDIKN
ncbi:apolipoprotein N-acyltransferase, partial [Bacteroidota bacterium]